MVLTTAPKLNILRELLLVDGRPILVDQKYYNHLMAVSKWRWVNHHGGLYSTKKLDNGKPISVKKYIMMLEGKFIPGLEIEYINGDSGHNYISNLKMVPPAPQQIKPKQKKPKTTPKKRSNQSQHRPLYEYKNREINVAAYDEAAKILLSTFDEYLVDKIIDLALTQDKRDIDRDFWSWFAAV